MKRWFGGRETLVGGTRTGRFRDVLCLFEKRAVLVRLTSSARSLNEHCSFFASLLLVRLTGYGVVFQRVARVAEDCLRCAVVSLSCLVRCGGRFRLRGAGCRAEVPCFVTFRLQIYIKYLL